MDVDQLKQLIQQYFIDPLNKLPIAQIKLLETNHDQSVRDFEEALGPLFGPDGSAFEGKAADAVAEYIGKYLNAEGLLSAYESDGLSDRITTLLSKCATALADEESLMKSIQWNAAWVATGTTLMQQEQQIGEEVPPGPEDPVWDIIQVFIIIGAAVTFVWTSADQQNKINDLTGIMNTWIHDMQTLAQQADPQGSQLPGSSGEITTAITMDTEQIVANSLGVTLTPEQEKLVQTLADEYGLSIEEITEILALDPTVTEAELREKIKRYLQLRQQYPTLAANNPQWLLWAAAFGLSDKAVALLANLNDRKTTTYLKGKPLDEIAADILGAVLGDLTQEASVQLRDLVKQARAAKVARIPLDEAISNWDDLPAEVQKILAWNSGSTNYAFQYGKAIESLVKQKLEREYGDMQSFYEDHFDLKFNKGLPDNSKLLPDAQITVDGHIDVLDITSLKNAPTKVKYDVNGVEIIIVLTYGG